MLQGGPATEDEMCLSFAIYYPRTELASCISSPNFYSSDYLSDFLRDYVPT